MSGDQDEARPILRVGLTGGIASGKTTVAGILAELGAFVVDADRLAREVMAPGGAAHDRVVARFGRGILDASGEIVRPRLAELVFRDAEARRALDAIVHPEVRAEASRRIEAHLPRGTTPLAIFDAALLFESGAYREFDRLIVVRCSPACQLGRLLARDELTADEARARIESQARLEEKLAVADYVIDTESTLHETRRQTEQVYARLLDDFKKKFG